MVVLFLFHLEHFAMLSGPEDYFMLLFTAQKLGLQTVSKELFLICIVPEVKVPQPLIALV